MARRERELRTVNYAPEDRPFVYVRHDDGRWYALDAKTLKRLGVSVTNDTDAPLIKSVDGDVEKLVSALIKSATKDASEVAA